MFQYICLVVLILSTIVAGFNTPISGVPYDADCAVVSHTMMLLSLCGLWYKGGIEL